jgi:RNA polymerase sigma factor (sigma-70 family)
MEYSKKNEEIVAEIRAGVSVNENLTLLYYNNLSLIKHLCKRYEPYSDLEDLWQESYFAVVEAVEHYDSSKGKFLTILPYYIKKYILRYLNDQGQAVKIPIDYSNHIQKYSRFKNDFYIQYGRYPTNPEVAAALNVTLEQVADFMRYGQSVARLDAPKQSEDETYLLVDTLQANCNVEEDVVEKSYREHEKEILWRVVKENTTGREYSIIVDRFKNNMTLQDVGTKNKISDTRVQQIQNNALSKLARGRALKALKEKLEIVESQKYSCGLGAFNSHGFTSSTERKALRMIELREEYKKRLEIKSHEQMINRLRIQFQQSGDDRMLDCLKEFENKMNELELRG